ncbi:MAG: acetyl-CoA decarbonylase/synthase complex subunit gamma [Anaerolineae bacterium]
MALTGLQIYKLLPKTNCKECGFPTCLAFAMKLAAKQAELASCPYVTEEAKVQLEAAAAPPIRLVTISSDGRKISVGNETVLFRHEKTFYHPPGLLVRVRDTMPLEEVKATAAQVANYSVEYVGLHLSMDGIAVEAASGDAAAFARCVAAVREVADMPLVLMAQDPVVMEAGLEAAAGTTPLIYAADADNWQAMAELARRYKAPLAVRTDGDLNALANLVEQVKGTGIQDLVLDPGALGFYESLAALTQIRRLALKKNFRPLGFPIITFPGQGVESVAEEVMLAGQHIAKYAGFVVMDHFQPAIAYPLLTLRQNIYTDPQKPIQVKPGLYEINNPQPDSPLMVTTNFSITYFSVANEVDGSGLPGWLLVADAEGMSVLTAWAAGKFDAEKIAKAVTTTGIADRISHRKLIIPGAVAVLMGELEEELPGWEILVGPREAVDLPAFLKLWTAT